MQPAISVRNLSKCYKLGAISRQTLVDEVRYWWSKVRGRNPQEHFAKIGHNATETRRVEAVNAGEDRFWALRDISFDVKPGEVIGLIGRNGAGKSTLLKLLTRITEPTYGEAIINGRVASLLEVGTGFHPELTGRENIYMNGTILGMKKREIDAKFNEIVAFSELEKFIDTPVKRYSSGMYVRLAFAVAAHLEPEILLVDEVLAVGDAEFQKRCLGKMKSVADSGRTVLFVSHQMNAVRTLCSRCIQIHQGKIFYDGETSNGVSAYEAGHFGKTNESKIEERMHGFIDWRLLKDCSEEIHTLYHTGPCTFAFTLKLTRSVRHGKIGFIIRTSDREIVFGDARYNIHIAPGLHEIRISLPSLPIMPGFYSLQVSLHDDIGKIDIWETVPSLKIAVKPFGHPLDEWNGILNIVSKWKVDDDSI